MPETEYKAICKCHACDKEFEVYFLLPPSEEDKLGHYCDECAEEAKAEKE